MSGGIVGAVLWLVLPSLLPTLALIGTLPQAPFLAAIITALMAAVSGMIATLTATSLLPWLIIQVLAANTVGLWFLFKRRLERPPKSSMLVALAVMSSCLVPMVGLLRMPVDWDARSIWLFHARWFYAGGQALRDAIVNPVFAFSHPGYPPLVPSVIGAVWRFGGAIDLPQGQALIAVLNLCLAALIAFAIADSLPGSVIGRAMWGALTALAVLGASGSLATNGYVDLVWAAATAGSVLYLLVAPKGRVNFTIGSLLAVTAALTKNEGLVAGLLVMTLAAFRYRSRIHGLVLAGCGVLVLAWTPIVQSLGIPNLSAAGNPLRLLRGEASVWRRVAPSAEAMLPFVSLFAAVGFLCWLLSLPSLNQFRKSRGLGAPMWAWLATIGVSLSLWLAYVISPHDLQWHLTSSVDRTTIAIRILLLSEILLWGALATQQVTERQWLKRSQDC